MHNIVPDLTDDDAYSDRKLNVLPWYNGLGQVYRTVAPSPAKSIGTEKLYIGNPTPQMNNPSF